MHVSRLDFCAQRGTVFSWNGFVCYVLCRKEVECQIWDGVNRFSSVSDLLLEVIGMTCTQLPSFSSSQCRISD